MLPPFFFCLKSESLFCACIQKLTLAKKFFKKYLTLAKTYDIIYIETNTNRPQPKRRDYYDEADYDKSMGNRKIRC